MREMLVRFGERCRMDALSLAYDLFSSKELQIQEAICQYWCLMLSEREVVTSALRGVFNENDNL